jgi:hypothetical protein
VKWAVLLVLASSYKTDALISELVASGVSVRSNWSEQTSPVLQNEGYMGVQVSLWVDSSDLPKGTDVRDLLEKITTRLEMLVWAIVVAKHIDCIAASNVRIRDVQKAEPPEARAKKLN